jgi:hypothetical protein
MDIINQRKKTQGPAPVSAEDVSAQQQAAATGKAGRASGGPAMSNVGSQLAAATGQQQLDAINTQGMIQQQGLKQAETQQNQQFGLAQNAQTNQFQQQQANIAAQTQQADAARAAREEMAVKELQQREDIGGKELSNGYANALANMASERGIVEQDIFMNAARERESFGADQFKAYLDQAAHAMAMSNQKYVDELTRIGQQANLQDEIEFRKEAQKLAFGQDFEIMNQQFDMKKLMNADEREFKKAMAQMDMDTAMKLAEQASKEQAYTSILTGATSMATAYAISDSPNTGVEGTTEATSNTAMGASTSGPTIWST